MAYDPLHKELVVFSGKYYNSSFYRECYTFDFLTKKWQSRPTSSLMDYRYRQRMWWDSIRKRVMLYGGSNRQNILLNDLWEWDGKLWAKVVTKTAGPKRSHFCVATNPKTGKTLVFGGYGAKSGTYDVWELSNPSIAEFTVFGTGCKGTAGVPLLQAEGVSRPWLGETFKTVTTNLPVFSGFALNIVGFSRDKWALGKLPSDLSPIGMVGCQLFVSPDILLPILNTGGKASWSIALPKDPKLKGQRFFVQTFVFDAKANKAGLTISNAGEALMGFRR